MKILKYKIAADIDSMSNLYILPHLALLFTAVSTMKMISTIYWFERGGRDDGLPNLESFLVVALMLPIFIGYKYGKSPSITNRIRLFTKLSSVCFILGGILITAGLMVPQISCIASGSPLIFAGLLATLLNRRKQIAHRRDGEARTPVP
ncbi:MAG: hypothetical protein H6992_13860 [Pseudomonadales bacterium]|nr:hypothetical protein [Pseudomonadales bacterium]